MLSFSSKSDTRLNHWNVRTSISCIFLSPFSHCIRISSSLVCGSANFDYPGFYDKCYDLFRYRGLRVYHTVPLQRPPGYSLYRPGLHIRSVCTPPTPPTPLPTRNNNSIIKITNHQYCSSTSTPPPSPPPPPYIIT